VKGGGNSLFNERELDLLDIDFFIWTPIMKGYATLNEMRTIYDVDDVALMHQSIAFQNELEYRQNKEASKG